MYLHGMVIADNAQRRFLNEAMPNAPVVDDGRSPEALAKRHQRGRRLASSLARVLSRTRPQLRAS